LRTLSLKSDFFVHPQLLSESWSERQRNVKNVSI
jgi:hypothetical protein